LLDDVIYYYAHHQCEAFTWRDITHNVLQAVARCAQCALTPDFIPPDLWCLNSPDLNTIDYSFWSIMQEKVYQTHVANIDELKHRLVQVWPGMDHRHNAAAIGQRRCHLNASDSCVKAQGGYFDQHLR